MCVDVACKGQCIRIPKIEDYKKKKKKKNYHRQDLELAAVLFALKI